MREIEKLLDFVREELKVLHEQGCDTWELEREAEQIKVESGRDALSRASKLCEEMAALRPSPDFPYREPNDPEAIRAERPEGPRAIGAGISDGALRDKTLGGWLGKAAGCMLGKPVEGWMRQQIVDLLEAAGEYPLRDYFPANPPGEWGGAFSNPASPTLRGNITRSVRDDDTDYPIVGLRIMEAHAKDFESADVARFWLSHLPYERTYTAERAAYRNFVGDLWPPESAVHRNPYREWIGGQIRADTWGYACPGRPQEAAALAFKDASISHTRNGIYGAMWVAAAIAAAFVAQEPEQAIRIGLSEIPRGCRLAEAIEKVLAWREEDDSSEQATERVLEGFAQYHMVHTIPNAAIVAMALLWGERNFTRSIGLAVAAGLDTDCNGATVGSIMGVMIGAEAIPEHWRAPLNDRLESIVTGDSDVRISDLAQRTLKLQALRA